MNAKSIDNLAMKELEQKMKEAFTNLKESICEIENAWINKAGISQEGRKQLEERREDRIPVRIGNSWNQMDFKDQEQLGNMILDDLEKTRERLRCTMQKLGSLHEIENKELQTEEIENLQIDFDEESFDFIGEESERNNGGGVHEDEDTYICKDKGNNVKLETIAATQEDTTTAAVAAPAAPAETTTIYPINTPALNPPLEQQNQKIHQIQEIRQAREVNQQDQEQLAKIIETASQLCPQQLPPSLSNKPTQLQYQMLLQQQQRQFQLLNQQFQQQQKTSQNNGMSENNQEEPLDTIDEECPSKEIFQLERNYSLQIKSLGFMAQVLQCNSGECFVFAKYGDFNTLRGPFSKQGAILLFEERVGLQRAQLSNKVNNQTQQNK